VVGVERRPRPARPARHGRFLPDGTARFEANDELEGKAIGVRFVWSDITQEAARWEQFFPFIGAT
jgi:hypothetical protein